MKGQKQLFSTGKDDWRTPRVLFNALKKLFEFTVDAAADNENHLCETYITAEQDALKVDWGFSHDIVFCNPPYSLCPKFIRKAYEESKRVGGPYKIVLLIPARTSNKEWHKYIFGKATELIFIKGRVKFSESELGAPFPSVCVVFCKDSILPTVINTLDYKELEDGQRKRDREAV